MAAPERDARAEALARARGLTRGVESMGQRLDQQRQQGGEQALGPGARLGSRARQAPRPGLGRAKAGQQGGQAGGGGRQGDCAEGGQRAGGQQMSGDMTGGRFEGGGNFEPRQFQREARERRTEAEALRRELQALGVDARELDALISNMRALDSARVYTNLDEAARLQTQLAEGFRRFEFDLRRKLGEAGANQLLLGGSDDTPAAYKKLVEDYYRARRRSGRNRVEVDGQARGPSTRVCIESSLRAGERGERREKTARDRQVVSPQRAASSSSMASNGSARTTSSPAWVARIVQRPPSSFSTSSVRASGSINQAQGTPSRA